MCRECAPNYDEYDFEDRNLADVREPRDINNVNPDSESDREEETQ